MYPAGVASGPWHVFPSLFLYLTELDLFDVYVLTRTFTRSFNRAGGLRCAVGERMFVAVDRLSELESWRRSLAMANPQSEALTREEAMRLLAELQDVERKLWALKQELRRLAEGA